MYMKPDISLILLLIIVVYNIMQDKVSNNWWYYFGEEKEPIGYWPPSLFKELKDGAKTVRFGGFVMSQSQWLPDMGNGIMGPGISHFRKLLWLYDDKSLNNNNNASTNEDLPLVEIETKCYKVGRNSTMLDPEFWGYSFGYGGKGGHVLQCAAHQ